jgi:NADH dehydrogenase
MILVAGATGVLGGLVTRQLLARGRPVRALVRDQAAAEPLQEAGATLVYGDLKDRDSLTAAVDGVEVVVTTANSAHRGGADTIESVDRAGNANLIDAATKAGVRQFLFVSALGSTPESPAPFLRAKGETEARLRASGMPFTIIAPNIFMEVWVAAVVGAAVRANRPVVVVGEGRRRHSFVSFRDVGAFIVAAVGHDRAINQYLPIGGPTPVSWRDVVAAYERVIGRDIPIQSVAPGDPGLGLPEPMPSLLASMDTYDSPLDMSELARTFGVSLTSIDAFVREDLGRAGMADSRDVRSAAAAPPA